jgi:hypothetical protein
MATYFHSRLADLSDAGVMGYYFLFPELSSPPEEPVGSIFGFFILPNKTVEECDQIFVPLEQTLGNNTFGWEDPIKLSGISVPMPDLLTGLDVPLEEGIRQSIRLGSRLLGRAGLNGDAKKLNKLLRKALTGEGAAAWGTLVA